MIIFRVNILPRICHRLCHTFPIVLNQEIGQFDVDLITWLPKLNYNKLFSRKITYTSNYITKMCKKKESFLVSPTPLEKSLRKNEIDTLKSWHIFMLFELEN